MARKPRFILPGVPQHVIQRGHNRDPCFYSEQDYIRYVANLREAAERNKVAIHAYVLMTNHVHYLVTPGHAHGVSHTIQDTGRKYVRYINTRYKRIAHRVGRYLERLSWLERDAENDYLALDGVDDDPLSVLRGYSITIVLRWGRRPGKPYRRSTSMRRTAVLWARLPGSTYMPPWPIDGASW